MKGVFLVFILVILGACYTKPEIKGFDEKQWQAALQRCSDSRIELAKTILDHQEVLLGKGQAEVKQVLGPPDEHELYRRNQKFFYYNLSLRADSCKGVPQRLSIRFDALDRVKELLIVE